MLTLRLSVFLEIEQSLTHVVCPQKRLPAGLLLSEVANDGQLDAPAAKGADEYDQPDDEDSETHQLQYRQGHEDGRRNQMLHGPGGHF